jgi:FkbM family methyltransferase
MSGEDTIVRVQTLYGTFSIDAVRDKKMAQVLERGAYPSEDLLRVTRAFVSKKDTVVDIGAHIGTFAVPIAETAGTVIAFEPSPEAFALLSRNATEHAVPLRLINKALGSKKGTGSLLTRNASNAGANTLVAGTEVPVTTLDAEITHADFIKIDVEGMELGVLRGGAELIRRARPVILFEVNLSQLRTHGASPRALERFFTERDYRLYIPFGLTGRALARVQSATLLTAFIAPRAWLLRRECPL